MYHRAGCKRHFGSSDRCSQDSKSAGSFAHSSPTAEQTYAQISDGITNSLNSIRTGIQSDIDGANRIIQEAVSRVNVSLPAHDHLRGTTAHKLLSRASSAL